MKKILKYILCSAMFIGLFFPTTVSAAEKEDSSYMNKADKVTECATDEFSSKIQESYEKIISFDMLQEGDVHVLGIRNGEVYYVEVVNVTEPSYATYSLDDPVKTTTFLFTKTNILGIKTNLMAVTATLRWIRNEKITSFELREKIYNSSIYASWEPDYWTQTDTVWGRVLNVIWENGDAESLCFMGSIFYWEGEEHADITMYGDE